MKKLLLLLFAILLFAPPGRAGVEVLTFTPITGTGKCEVKTTNISRKLDASHYNNPIYQTIFVDETAWSKIGYNAASIFFRDATSTPVVQMIQSAMFTSIGTSSSFVQDLTYGYSFPSEYIIQVLAKKEEFYLAYVEFKLYPEPAE